MSNTFIKDVLWLSPASDVSLVGMLLPQTRLSVAILLVMSMSRTSFAQESNRDPDRVGDTRMALAGIQRVPFIATTAPRLALAFDAGYGLTESQKSEGAHHRFLGTVGVGAVALRGLEFGLLAGIRHDRHPDDGMGTDSGTVGDASLVARYGVALNQAWRLGLDLGANFPGSEKPGDSLSSPAIDSRALIAWSPNSRIDLAGFAGFRFDKTAGVGAEAARYRFGDRLALGVSDYNAVLVGVGAVAPLGRTELLGEVTGDLLVGKGAPAFTKSPLRLDLGVRHALSSALALQVLSELALSARPDLTANSPLVPIEPRFSVLLGLRYRLWDKAERVHPDSTLTATPPATATMPEKPSPTASTVEAPAAAPPAVGQVSVTVLDFAGRPLSDAVVELTTPDGAVHELEYKTGSTFSLETAPLGRGQLAIRAELMRDWTKEVEIVRDQPLELRVEMVAGENAGQIRGVIRGFDGKSLSAHVRIEPGGREVKAGLDGAFSADVAPGKYRVKIWLEGYQPQLRNVEVGKNGVMVLNVDLQKGR